MFQKTKLSNGVAGHRGPLLARAAQLMAGTLFSVSVAAQQAGGIQGKVTFEGAEAEGVTVKAASSVMPRPRTATTDDDGKYSLPQLIPGTYTLTFTTDDGATRTMTTEVLLDQVTQVRLDLGNVVSGGELEEITVTGQVVTVGGSASLSNAIGADVIESMPAGQDYRDLMKLIPGVQYTQDSIRGPSAGGSGQDNVYKVDGANVTLPMFGTLSSEVSNHDVEQISVERGGARAIGFNRSGGISVDSKTKSGTNEYHASVEYKFQTPGMSEKSRNENLQDDLDQSWMIASASGPLVEDRLFFYGSYYGPRETRDNKETAYGPTKGFSRDRDEYFGKLTYAPIDNLLLNLGYRTSERIDKGDSVGAFEADTASQGSRSTQDIITLDGSWIIGDTTTLSFQYSDYALETSARPDTMLDVQPAVGQALDIDNLDQMGYFAVPNTIAGEGAWNAFVQDYIDRYGYLDESGTRVGGGGVGGYSQIQDQNFYNKSFELALDHSFYTGPLNHQLHFGYQWSEGREELVRLSNGWGIVSMIDGAADEDTPNDAYFRATTQQMSLVQVDDKRVPPINSYTETHNFEVNDSIEWGDFIFDVGFLISEDILYGQGLREADGTLSGYEAAPGHKYEMYKVDWKDMIQPRLGVTWAYNGVDTLFASFAQYNPSASSLARAASWDRNTQATQYVYWDAEGNFIDTGEKPGSSGKLFADNLTPRRVDELTVGTTKELDHGISLRSHVRYREGSHFWEDTWNWSREYGCYGPELDQCVPEHIAEKGAYIPDLEARLDEIGSGSTFVVAELDDARTKYWEFNLEAEWRGERTYLNASYVWSRYTGNFDQDNTSSVNDANRFMGSSSIADSRGMMLWDNKEGTLRGDRPHLLKMFGRYDLDWNANVGAYLVYQSGQPWEAWDGSIYGYTSDSIRYAEKAGSRRTPSHWQMDLSYTQNFNLFEDYRLKFRADLFNVLDRQTGYNYQPSVHEADFGEARNYYAPRSLRLSVGVDF